METRKRAAMAIRRDDGKEQEKQLETLVKDMKEQRNKVKLMKMKLRRERKKVLQYTLDGSFVKEYPNLFTAQKEMGLWNISLAVLGIIPDAGGYKWSYKIQ